MHVAQIGRLGALDATCSPDWEPFTLYIAQIGRLGALHATYSPAWEPCMLHVAQIAFCQSTIYNHPKAQCMQ